jgi:hypothetical protein
VITFAVLEKLLDREQTSGGHKAKQDKIGPTTKCGRKSKPEETEQNWNSYHKTKPGQFNSVTVRGRIPNSEEAPKQSTECYCICDKLRGSHLMVVLIFPLENRILEPQVEPDGRSDEELFNAAYHAFVA